MSSKKEEHQDPSGLSMKKLERGVWFVEHRESFRKALAAFLILVGTITWGYTLYYVTTYLAWGMERDAYNMQVLASRQLPGHDYTLQVAPDPIQTSKVRSLNNEGRTDILVSLQNPNPVHYAYFDYCFVGNGKNLKCDTDFLLPGQQKFVFDLAEKGSVGSAIEFKLKNVDWDRLDPHSVPDWQKYEQDKLDIDIKDIKFTPASSNELSKEVDLAILSFSAVNNTAYNYHQLPLQIILYKGGRIVGVNRYSLVDFRSLEETQVEIRWPHINFDVSEVEIRPDVNILDSSNFKKPGE